MGYHCRSLRGVACLTAKELLSTKNKRISNLNKRHYFNLSYKFYQCCETQRKKGIIINVFLFQLDTKKFIHQW